MDRMQVKEKIKRKQNPCLVKDREFELQKNDRDRSNDERAAMKSQERYKAKCRMIIKKLEPKS